MSINEMIEKLEQFKQEGVNGNTEILFDMGCEGGEVVTNIYYNKGTKNDFWLGQYIVIN